MAIIKPSERFSTHKIGSSSDPTKPIGSDDLVIVESSDTEKYPDKDDRVRVAKIKDSVNDLLPYSDSFVCSMAINGGYLISGNAQYVNHVLMSADIIWADGYEGTLTKTIDGDEITTVLTRTAVNKSVTITTVLDGNNDISQQGISVGPVDMILVYAIPDPNTPIQLAIQANSTWFSAGQAVVINWGDGSAVETVSASSGQSGYIGHTYASAGTYRIKISGSMTMYGRSSNVDIAGQTLLTRVDSFGKLGLTSFLRAFQGCAGLTSVSKTLPDNVTNMESMFRYCSGAAFNPDVSKWDVSKVTNMWGMFHSCSGDAFNPDVSNWDVSEVTDMRYMFFNCRGAAFRGGRGDNGIGIANWKLKTGNNAVLMTDFMLSSKTQEPAFLDEILNAWAALHAQGKLPTNITVHFGTNKYTAAGATAYTTLTDDAGWTIASGGLQA